MGERVRRAGKGRRIIKGRMLLSWNRHEWRAFADISKARVNLRRGSKKRI
jgi:hypothetical protein